jgi:hypothetical protein
MPRSDPNASPCTFFLCLLLAAAGSWEPTHATAASAQDDRWDSRFGAPSEIASTNILDGANGPINVIVRHRDFYRSILYVGGSFTRIGDIEANNVAFWDGETWHPIGEGTNNGVHGEVRALAVGLDGPDSIVVGGDFDFAGSTPVNHIAHWDGTNWSALGMGVNGRVRAVGVLDATLYAGGDFTTAGGNPAAHIARFTSTNGWEELGGGVDDSVHAIFADEGNHFLFIGGRFTRAGGLIPAQHIVRWADDRWNLLGTPLINGVNGHVNAIVQQTDASAVYVVGGAFTFAGDVPAANLAFWDYSRGWREIGGGVQGAPASVRALSVESSMVYVAGEFQAVGGQLARNIARFDGQRWLVAPGGGPDNVVNALAADSSSVYVGGSFAAAGDIPSAYVARWMTSPWAALGKGLNGRAYAVATLGDDVYVGGDFTLAGDVHADHVARWDGAQWHSLGAGIANGVDGQVLDLVFADGALYVAGTFTNAGGARSPAIARWDPEARRWSSLGGGLDSSNSFLSGRTIAARGSDIYVGGYFTRAGGVSARSIALWNGTSWAALNVGIEGEVRSIVLTESGLYAGGDFDVAGGQTATNIARWDGTNWHPLISGSVNGAWDIVNSMALDGSSLYVAGRTIAVDPAQEIGSSVARWDGASWDLLRRDSDFRHPRDIPVERVVFERGSLYVMGWDPRIYRWDGEAWSYFLGQPFSSFNGDIVSDAEFGANLVVCGKFPAVDDVQASYVAELHAGAVSRWTSLVPTTVTNSSAATVDVTSLAVSSPPGSGLGLNAAVSVLAGSGPYIYAGGSFTNAGGVAVTGLARWNGTRWSNIGNVGGNFGNGQVMSLATSGNNLYVGGSISRVDNEPVQNIAHWNGVSWSRLGRATTNIIFIPPFGGITNIMIESPSGQVRAIAVVGSNVYAGGAFTSPGYSIVRWDGANWSKLSDIPAITNSFELTDGLTGLNGSPGGPGDCNTIVVRGTDLFVAGNFSRAGTNAASNIARWDGAHWHPLGAGLNGWVQAMALDSTRLYVSGYFTEAGGVAATNLACWDGVRWSAVDPAFQEQVYALALHGNHLYIGGVFTNAGSVPAANIARWDGTAWTSLGSGITGGSFPYVNTLLLRDNSLYVGGGFTSAGAGPSYNFARWSLAAADATEWRSIYFTLAERADPGISGDDADPDGDGMTNRQEYLAGTDPRSAQSVFDVNSVQASGDSVIVTFQAASGRTYTVQYRDGVGEPATWNRLADIPSRSSAGTETVIDSIPSPNGRFYRVVSPAVP